MIPYSKKVNELLKNPLVLLEGSHNPFDGCWGIPIAKVKLHDNHFNDSILHSGLYLPKNKITSTRVISQSYPTKDLLTKPYDTNVFTQLNYLLDHNILDDTIAKFKQADAKEKSL